LEVAQAAFDITDWHTKPPAIQRDISFVILRAQKPLMYVAEPFLPFTLGTYMLVRIWKYLENVLLHRVNPKLLGFEELLSLAGPDAGIDVVGSL